MNTICLVMIVRNEAAVVQRCLDSIRPWINHWVICDTGSTDATPQIIEAALAGIPGELRREPWVNFGHNRTLALKHARGKADYHLLLDADMTLNVAAEFREDLADDVYLIRHEGDSDYWVERLVSDRHAWEYRGVTHEYIWSPTAASRSKLRALSVTHHEDGGCRADKYQRDIALLRRGLEVEPANSRYAFYLAQSYRDLGNFPQALEYYEQRAAMGGWDEEAWYSLYQVARLRQRLGYAWPLVLDAYLAAYQFRPSRREPLYHLARFCRKQGQPALAFLFARQAMEISYPEDILFVEKPVYERLLREEFEAAAQTRPGR
ncbi:MAG TPA: glycosyltransferase [Verrucomicrobiae bacterium]